MTKALLLIRFDESHFYVRTVWTKYILMNGIFTLVLFGEQKFWFCFLEFVTTASLFFLRTCLMSKTLACSVSSVSPAQDVTSLPCSAPEMRQHLLLYDTLQI